MFAQTDKMGTICLARRACFLRMVSPFLIGVGACSSLMACGDSAPTVVDSGTVDSGTIDAPLGACPNGELEVQGDWLDWDSTDQSFLGIFNATVKEGAIQATTAPNGRAVLCLAAGVDHRLEFTHPDYLPMTATLAATNLTSTYSVHGLTPTRADELFKAEFSAPRNITDAQVLIQLPPDASATLGTTSAGVAPVPSSNFLLFANVSTGSGSTSITITPPPGSTCTAVDTIPLVPNVISFTSVVCKI